MAFFVPEPENADGFHKQIDKDRFGLNHWLLPEADRWLMKTAAAEILIQQLALSDFRLIALQGNTTEKQPLKYMLPARGFVFNYILQATTNAWYEHKEDLMHSGRYTLFFYEPGLRTWNVPKGIFSLLQLYISAEHISSLNTSFPLTTAFLSRQAETGKKNAVLGSFQINAELNQSIWKIITCKFSGSTARKYYHLKIAELLFDFCQQLTIQGCTLPLLHHNPDARLLQEVLEYIHNNLHEHLHIAGIMKTFHISEYKLKKLFHDTGKSFAAHLTEARMKKSMLLLKNTGRKIAVIAKDVGYVNPSKFSHMFFKHYGIFPRDVRLSSPDQAKDSPDQSS
ncbi:helix-turn-helix transcriptional regulator [Chitinophaga sp. Mgbs1]|uniref:Helix-turn-helix transcriptional regulator n=1 Tax=Chitinophaga solisilvae TaxID=1233460 RepID=A0A3S1CUR2_9BACT|nr:helix-turn-helix transcriptional regulator [Chitinophaga solisilvae]